MRSIRLKNFRSFEDTQRIELRPINVLVGANSSGKSSFLRFFPLLRQSVETPSQSPLLWYTDTGYVDFGDFSQTVRRAAEPKAIQVELEIHPSEDDDPDVVPTTLSVTLHEQAGRTQVDECVIRCNDDSCRLVFDSSGVLTLYESNGFDVLAMDPGWGARHHGSVHLVPAILQEFTAPGGDTQRTFLHPPGFKQLLTELQPLMHGKTTDETAQGLANRMQYGNAAAIKEQLCSLQESAERKQHVDEMDPEGHPFRKIRSLLLAKAIPGILFASRRAVDRYAKGVKYLGPFRVAPERFYRHQALAIQQIEPHGENLAMFLRALPDEELQDLSRFVHEHLGFGLSMRTEGSHVSILIEEDNVDAFNLIDMGYGFSQVLPVVVQAWTMASGFRSSEREVPTTLLAIEQPELHLHPHHQARLADMLTGVVKASHAVSKGSSGGGAGQPSGVQILVETHSEALVNRLGELVEAGDFPVEDISVLLFEKDPKTGITTVRQSRYADDGTLVNWPIGFFAP